jgi:hypothetical protein
MSTTPRAAARPVWVPVPFLVRARTGFVWMAASGVLFVVSIQAGAWVGEDDTTPVVLAFTALVCLTILAACTGFFVMVAAANRGPGDGMSAYGAGRRVEVTWASHRHERGRVEVEDIGEGEVVVLPREGGAPHVTLRLGGHDLLVQGGPGPTATEWYTLVDDAGYTVARADAARHPGADPGWEPVDWTVRPARGPALRLRHRPHGPLPARVTLLDDLGTAWWVRNARCAELPDDFDPASAVFVVLMIDQLRTIRLRRVQEG